MALPVVFGAIQPSLAVLSLWKAAVSTPQLPANTRLPRWMVHGVNCGSFPHHYQSMLCEPCVDSTSERTGPQDSGVSTAPVVAQGVGSVGLAASEKPVVTLIPSRNMTANEHVNTISMKPREVGQGSHRQSLDCHLFLWRCWQPVWLSGVTCLR